MQTSPTKERLYFLDWTRVLAFLLLILYHTGMGYVGPIKDWGWHVKNSDLSETLGLFMLLTGHWRMALLFLVSGAAVCYALRSQGMRRLLATRVRRLLWPLLAGMLLFIVPLQIYIERLWRGQFTGSFFEFWPSIFNTGTYPSGNLSWHHLWYVVYLLVYTLLLATPFAWYLAPERAALRDRVARALASPWLVMLPMSYLLWVSNLYDSYPSTHNLTWDWANHLKFGFAFVIGFLFAASNTWDYLQRHARTLLWAGGGLLVAYYVQRIFLYTDADSLQRDIRLLCYTLSAWPIILAALGYAKRLLNRSNRWLHYANEAVYPFYILHQTITVVLVYALLDWQVSWVVKYGVVAVGTFAGCGLLYELLIRRVPVLRFLFGMPALPVVQQSAATIA